MKKLTVLFFKLFALFLHVCMRPEKEEAVEEKKAVTESVTEESDVSETMPEFSVKDLEGNTVTNDIFSQADITVVNFWAT